MSTPAYQTIIVKFREAITELDGIFRDMQFWGGNSQRVDR